MILVQVGILLWIHIFWRHDKQEFTTNLGSLLFWYKKAKIDAFTKMSVKSWKLHIVINEDLLDTGRENPLWSDQLYIKQEYK